MTSWRQRFTLEVYYDGWCPMCTAISKRLGRFDWLGLLQFKSIREPGALRGTGIAAEEAERRMYVRSPRSGRAAGGIWAVATLAYRLPLLLPLAPFITLAGALGLGQRAYDWLASRRSVVPVGHCTDGACEVPGHRADGGRSPD